MRIAARVALVCLASTLASADQSSPTRAGSALRIELNDGVRPIELEVPEIDGQELEVTGPSTLRRVTPATPAIELELDARGMVPGSQSCKPVLADLREVGDTELLRPAELPDAFQNRSVISGKGVLVVCEDFTGGHQLRVRIRSAAPVTQILSSAGPALEAIHGAFGRALAVKPQLIEPAAAELQARQARAMAPAAARRLHGAWIAALLQAVVLAPTGDDIDDTSAVAGLGYWVHLRSPSLYPVAQFARAEIELGAGLQGGFAYALHLDYGVSLGSERHYVGVAPSGGLSGFTGGRLEFAFHAGAAITAVTTLGPVKLIAAARELFVTGSQRQDGSDLVVLGDEATASLRVLWLTEERRAWGVGALYREARGTRFWGATLSYGPGMH